MRGLRGPAGRGGRDRRAERVGGAGDDGLQGSPIDKLAHLLGLRPGEARLVGPALALAFAAVGALGLSAIAADALFVSTFSLGALSRYLIVASITRVVVAFAYGALSRRFAGARADAALFAAAAAILVVSGVLARGAGPTLTYAICLAQLFLPPLLPLAAFNAALGCLHARQAKRLLPLVAAAATVGSIAVSAGAGVLAPVTGASGLLIAAGVLAAAALPWPAALASRGGAVPGSATPSAESGGLFGALADTARDVRTVPVVRIVVLGALSAAACTNLVDFAFKAALKESLGRDAMASYLGTFGAVSNGLVLIAQLFVTSRFVGRFGVRAALGTFPASLVAVAPVLLLAPGVATATLAKGCETVLRFSFGNSVADLLLTPAPAVVRTRAKVFVKGGAAPLGYLASAGVLAAFGAAGPSRSAQAVLIGVAGAFAVLAVRDARRAYTSALADAIGKGRISVDVTAASAAVFRAEIVRHLERACAAGDVDAAVRTLSIMGDRFFEVGDVAPGLKASSRDVRLAAIDAAVRIARPQSSRGRAGGRPSIPPPSVPAAAFTASGAAASRRSGPGGPISAPPVSATSARGAADGAALLALAPNETDLDVERALLAAAREMGATPDRERAQQAAVRAMAAGEGTAAVELWAEALICLALSDRDPAVKQLRKAALGADSPRRAAAVRALGVLVERRAEREVLRAMASDDPAVAAEAARTAVLIDAPGVIAALVMRLMTGPHVRAAARALSLAGPIAVNELVAALPTTRGESSALPTAVASGRVIAGTVRAARVLARLGPEACRRVLERFGDLGYRARNSVARALAASPEGTAVDSAPVVKAMELTVGYAEKLLAGWVPSRTGLLSGEIAHRLAETGERVLDLASVAGDRALIARARASLAPSASERDRGHALELLENVLPDTLAGRVVAVLERERAHRDGSHSGPGAPGKSEAAAWSGRALDGWLEKCRLFDAGELVLESAMMSVLERVLVLRDSSLFMGLSGEELYPVAEIAQPASFSPGEVVVRQGDPGDALFVVARGTLRVSKGDAVLREMGPGAVFGELALLDGAPRAATVSATTDAMLLRIPRAEFEALLDESPELARGVIRTLIGHLRAGA